MDNHIPPMMFLTICVSLLTALPQSHSEQHDNSNNHYADCSQPFSCGDAVSGVTYPFWGGNRSEFCGGGSDFKLHCEEDGQEASIQIGSRSFGVSFIHIYPSYTMGMFRQDLITNICSPQFGENDLSPGLFWYSEPMPYITIFYACPKDAPLGDNNYTCPNDEYPIAFYEDVNDTALYGEFPGLRDCNKIIEVPVSKSVRLDPNAGNIDALFGALREGFEVNYTVRFGRECVGCVKSGGACGTNDTATFQFTCHCPDGSDHASLCPGEEVAYFPNSQPFSCGDAVSGITYPFWGGNRSEFCGGASDFKLHCDDEDGQEASIQIGSRSFGVLFIHIYPSYTMGMFRQDLTTNICSPQFGENDLSPGLFWYSEPMPYITIFYACPKDAPLGDNNYTCPKDEYPIAFYEDVNDTALYGEFPGLRDCNKRIEVPVSKSVRLDPNAGNIDALYGALREGFEVNYTVRFGRECMGCVKSGGACGTNDTATFQFTCHCPDGSDHASLCHESNIPHHPWKWEAKLGIGATAAVFGVVLASMAFYFYQRRKRTHYAIPRIQSHSTSFDPSSKDSEEGGDYFGVSIFTYSELEEATNFFDSSKELGEGGFGIVYFGILRDGRCVAVKRLYENNFKRVEQFRNEVKILTRIRHRNLVSLYGCTSRHSRELLLVYEYISNGTIADHLHGERAKASTLPWHIRMNIAVETASALAYLHACGIIHRDVKTKNILLDSYFVVKVADFGLSRIILNHVTDISTAPQGTPGYVDPEYYERYRLTDKSDVYSFGVVLIELISSLPAVDLTRHSHEINLSSMAINKVHNQALHELVDLNLGFESDYKVRKMISEVAELAYQCLQSSSDKRPSMRQVMDTLKDIQSDDKCKSQPEVMDIST